MSETSKTEFAAQSLVRTKASDDRKRFELTFINAQGAEQTISVPIDVAAELAPVLSSLAAGTGRGRAHFTKLPTRWAIGAARHERLVLVRFDDDPPYGLDPELAESLWREMREEAESVARQRAPAMQ